MFLFYYYYFLCVCIIVVLVMKIKLQIAESCVGFCFFIGNVRVLLYWCVWLWYVVFDEYNIMCYV